MASPGLYCTRCGHMNDVQAAYCAKCGAPQPGAPAPAAANSPAPPLATSPALAYAPAPYVPATPRAIGYGGFWIRFVAVIIDAIIVSVALLPFRILIGGSLLATTGFPTHGRMNFPEMVPFFIAGGKIFLLERLGWWLYDALLTSSVKQGTVGKMAFGLKVVNAENGAPISFLHATGRHFAKYISMILCFVGFIIAGFTARKQALHDLIAGTVVIKTTN